MIVLDTNVVSELMTAEPDQRVVRWVRAQSPQSLVTTSVTVAEVRYGIARLPSGRRKTALEVDAEDIFVSFSGAVLPFDASAATYYADIVVNRERRGRPTSGFDAQIAAVCQCVGAALATRNTRDFEALGLDMINPWD